MRECVAGTNGAVENTCVPPRVPTPQRRGGDQGRRCRRLLRGPERDAGRHNGMAPQQGDADGQIAWLTARTGRNMPKCRRPTTNLPRNLLHAGRYAPRAARPERRAADPACGGRPASRHAGRGHRRKPYRTRFGFYRILSGQYCAGRLNKASGSPISREPSYR